MRWYLIECVTVFVAGCATPVGQMSMPNPALARDRTEATQSYEMPPYRSDHRYEATLEKWEPGALEFRVHFVDPETCGLPSSYTLSLLDDAGRRYAFEPEGEERSTKLPGHLGATLFDGITTGVFRVPVDAHSRFVTLEIRPKNDRRCSLVDFRWNFDG